MDERWRVVRSVVCSPLVLAAYGAFLVAKGLMALAATLVDGPKWGRRVWREWI